MCLRQNSFRLFALLLLLLLQSAAVWAEQYRSKELVDPGNSLSDSSALSVQELENQLQGMNDAYAKSSTQRHLARHYLQNKEYDKAVAFYEDALKEGGLSSYANIEMLKELVQVYMLQPDYASAMKTLSSYQQKGGKLNTDLYLMQAYASFKTRDYVSASRALDNALASTDSPSEKVLNKAISIYYQIGNYKKTAALLEKLLKRNATQSDTWHQLVAIKLKLGEQHEARRLLLLAWEKNMDFSHQQVSLLADLLANDGNPHKAARILTEGINKKLVIPTSADYQRLFSYWLTAREKDRALDALQKAAQLSNDTELDLYLAQLYMEQENWPKMLQAVLKTCAKPLEDKFVSQANLLLGIGQLKSGLLAEARRSFINATLFGGYGEKAGSYLRFMKAEPPSKREKRMFVGPCQSGTTTSRWAASTSAEETRGRQREVTNPVVKDSSSVSAGSVQIKTVPRTTFFYAEYTLSQSEFREGVTGKAIDLGMSATKSGGEIDGDMHFLFDRPFDVEDDNITFRMALPVSGRPTARGKHKIDKARPFKCSYLDYDGPAEGVAKAWRDLKEATETAGYVLTGESRQLFSADNSVGSDRVKTELQLGIE